MLFYCCRCCRGNSRCHRWCWCFCCCIFISAHCLIFLFVFAAGWLGMVFSCSFSMHIHASVCICISTTTTYALTLQHSFSAHRKFYKILVELALRWFILFVCFYFYFAAVFVRVFVAAAAAVMYTHSWELIVCWRCHCKMAWIKLSLCTVRRF